MCFTINVNIVKEEMERRFNTTLIDPDNYRPSYYYHAFELPRIPVISSENPDSVRLFQWGLIPSWSRNEEFANDIRYKTFNAKAETITEKPSFRNAVKIHRCLVISRGFYEWQTVGREKFPYFIYLRNNEIFAFAGIFDSWTNHETGEILNTFSIITTAANPLLEKIHNIKKRMPVILSPEDEWQWLDTSVPLSQSLQLLKPYDQARMGAHTISRLITKRGAEKNVPDLVKPFAYPKASLF
ncbi:MAG: SOS response-associated peptidase [Bacteroidales bacterium]|nr:MAG: SOS response-associated peptidase [Bacteroidales bacterium]